MFQNHSWNFRERQIFFGQLASSLGSRSPFLLDFLNRTPPARENPCNERTFGVPFIARIDVVDSAELEVDLEAHANDVGCTFL